MHRLAVGLIAVLIACSSFAQVPKKGVKVEKAVVCFPLKVLLDDLKIKYKEEPMIIGMTGTLEDVAMAVYINKETGSYTVIEFDEEAGCILSVGDRVRYRFPKLGSVT
jgi:hypothetical protein